MINKVERTARILSVGSTLQNFEFYSAIALLAAIVVFQARTLTKRKNSKIE